MSGKNIATVAAGAAFLLGALATILIVCAVGQLYINTHDLLVCRQRIAMSPNATQEDTVKLESLKHNFWTKLPKMAFVVIAALVGIISLSIFYVIAFSIYVSIIRRFAGSHSKKKKPKDKQKE